MSRRDRYDILTVIRRRTFTFIWVSTVFSLGFLILWIFGVPGVQNAYARGWALGLSTLFRYVVGCVLLLIIYAVVGKISERFENVWHFNLITIGIFWIFFLYSAFKIYRSFQIMFSGS